MIRSFDIAPGHPPKCPHELKKEVLYAKPFKGMQYTEGQKVFGPEDQLAFYSSGRVAVCVNEQPGGFFITAFDDTHEHPTIASFDPFGVGSVSYPSGQPRLTVDMTVSAQHASKHGVLASRTQHCLSPLYGGPRHP